MLNKKMSMEVRKSMANWYLKVPSNQNWRVAKRGQTGSNGAKLCQMVPNRDKRGQTGPNRAKWVWLLHAGIFLFYERKSNEKKNSVPRAIKISNVLQNGFGCAIIWPCFPLHILFTYATLCMHLLICPHTHGLNLDG